MVALVDVVDAVRSLSQLCPPALCPAVGDGWKCGDGTEEGGVVLVFFIHRFPPRDTLWLVSVELQIDSNETFSPRIATLP